MVSARQANLLPTGSNDNDNDNDALLPTDQSVEELRRLIREDLLSHLATVGLNGSGDRLSCQDPKEVIRANHAAQRQDYRLQEARFIRQKGLGLLQNFADGREIEPEAVKPALIPVNAGTEESELFRLATLFWSVPVSRGYGRRMRFLVRDESNGKLIGLFALADPVFNLRARDGWIGWNVSDRRQRLVNVMDAYVVGAVPPYSQLLGGKIVAALMTSQEVCSAFSDRYGRTRGRISQEYKHAQLTLITVTSALGRSSLYNRLKLPNIVEFYLVGKTEGWGHFQVPQRLFIQMRRLLALNGHPYASGHQFGQGPNWRMRVVREALSQVGLDQDLLRHGISREIYAAPLSPDWRAFLTGKVGECQIHRPSASEIGQAAVNRWLIPRAVRVPEYRIWTRYDTWQKLTETDMPNSKA